MRLSRRSIYALQKVITGDGLEDSHRPIAPYQKGHELEAFFEDIEGIDTDQFELGTRWVYVDEVLSAINGKPSLERVVQAALHPGRFMRTDFSVDEAVDFLNDFFELDGYRVRQAGKAFKIVAIDEVETVVVDTSALKPDDYLHDLILDQIQRANIRLEERDWAGAITSARSLVEAVLKEIERRLTGSVTDTKGDVTKHYNIVRPILNLHPKEHDVASLRLILQGLTNVVEGVGTLRTRMGDAHARTYKPDRHHAALAVNAANTVVQFLFDTYLYQEEQRTKNLE